MKLINKLFPKKIDQFVYCLKQADINSMPFLKVTFDEEEATINTLYDEKKLLTKHELLIRGESVYVSNTHERVHLMNCINEYKSPVIGDCFTKQEFRGQSIYPYMLQKVAKDTLRKSNKVFVLVSPDNIPSIRGIEKAGFKFKCRISVVRLGIFYVNKRITTKCSR